MSWLPSTVDSTERSWMPRFCATEATPAVRQLARPTSRYSIGVMPLSVGREHRRVVGVEGRLGLVVLLLAEAEEVLDLDAGCARRSATCEVARQVNWAASGAPLSASRASSSAWTLTPLSARGSGRRHLAMPLSLFDLVDRDSGQYTQARRLASRPWRQSTTPHGRLGRARSRRTTSTCRSRCRSTAGASCTRSASPTRPTATLSPARDNVILVCHALSGDAHAAGVSATPPAESTRDGFARRGPRRRRRQGARLVGRDDRPGQGLRHRPLLRGLHQPARRLPRHDRARRRPTRRPARRTARTSR